MSPRGFGSVFSSTRSLGHSRKTTASRRRTSATRCMPLAAESLESRAMLATTAPATGSMPLLPPTLVAPSATSADTIARPALAVAALSAPPSPTGLVAVPGDARVTLTWAAPSSNGGAAISDYVVQVSSNNGATWRPFADGVSTATAATVTGLTNGVRYVFRVAAVNAAGTGAASVASAAIVPRTVPGGRS